MESYDGATARSSKTRNSALWTIETSELSIETSIVTDKSSRRLGRRQYKKGMNRVFCQFYAYARNKTANFPSLVPPLFCLRAFAHDKWQVTFKRAQNVSAVKILAKGSTSATNKRQLALPIISRISAFPRCPRPSLCAHARNFLSAKTFPFSGKKLLKRRVGIGEYPVLKCY